jgi:hypothetical protein
MRRDKSIPPQSAPTTAQDATEATANVQRAEPAWVLEIACCCPSRPVVRVIVPAAADRPHPAELLLCGHHYRASQDALVRVRAAVYDRAGALISSASSAG